MVIKLAYGTRIETPSFKLLGNSPWGGLSPAQEKTLSMGGTHTIEQGAWELTKKFMLDTKPSVSFQVEDVLAIDFDKEYTESNMSAYVGHLVPLLKTKKNSGYAPWASMLQNLWLETDWKAKRKDSGKIKFKKSSGSILQGRIVRPSSDSPRFTLSDFTSLSGTVYTSPASYTVSVPSNSARPLIEPSPIPTFPPSVTGEGRYDVTQVHHHAYTAYIRHSGVVIGYNEWCIRNYGTITAAVIPTPDPTFVATQEEIDRYNSWVIHAERWGLRNIESLEQYTLNRRMNEAVFNNATGLDTPQTP